MAHPICLFFDYGDLPEVFLRELMHISSDMLSRGDVEREIRSAEFRGRLVSQYEVGCYANFKGVVFYGEILSKAKSYRPIILNRGENIGNSKDDVGLSILRAESIDEVTAILKHMEIINKN